MKRCDLHMHSSFSDGSMHPADLFELACSSSLSAVALTDHNTVLGLPEWMSAAKGSKVEAVAGCEFSCDYDKQEVHLLGLFLPRENWRSVERYVDELHERKHRSNVELLQRLNAAGYAVSYDEAIALTDASEFNRNQVARILLKKGYVSTVSEAFETVLKEGNGYYIPAGRLDFLETIRFIKDIGGVAVWAHPLYYMPDPLRVAEALAAAKPAGLDGLETIYTTYTKQQQQAALALAERFDLLCSGGSDFHGEGKPGIEIGTGKGNLCVPYRFYEALKQRAEKG